MRAEDARRQALKGLADAKKKSPAMRDRIEKAEGMLASPDFCRVPIKLYGNAFREFQAQADASCAAMLTRVTNAVASAVGLGDYDSILSRLEGWTEAKGSFETIQRYIENNEGGDTIMTSEIKNTLAKLISQTADDILAFDSLSCEYNGTDAGTLKDSVDRLMQVKDLIADTEIPNTEATYTMYQQIRAELDKIRDSIARGITYDIDTNINRLAARAEELAERAKSGDLSRYKMPKNADLGQMLPDTKTIDVGTVNPDDVDELDAGIVIYKTFNQAESIINKMQDDAISITNGIQGLKEDHQLQTLQARGEKLYKQLAEARTDGQKNIITSQLRNVMKQMNDRQKVIEANINKLSSYREAMGRSYNELAQYLESLESYFIPLPGQYKLTLKKYQEYLKTIERNINSVRPKKLFSRNKGNVVINSLADIVTLYQKALADHDNDTIDIIKTAIDVNVTNIRGKLPTVDVPDRETEAPVKEKTPEELEAERKEMEEFAKMFGGVQPEQPAKDPLTEFGGQFGGGRKEPEQPVTEPETEALPSEDEIESILQEVERMKNGE